MTYPRRVNNFVVRIMRELQRAEAQNNDVCGWFCLELEDPDLGRVTRLGAIVTRVTVDELLATEFATEHSKAVQRLGAGWVFALDYEVLDYQLLETAPRAMAGFVESSITVVHSDGSVHLEGTGQGGDYAVNDRVLRIAVQEAGTSVNNDEDGLDPVDVEVRWHTSDDAYLEQIETLRAELHGEPEGVACLTNRITVTHDQPIDPASVYAALSQSSESPRGGVIVMDSRSLVSASPETFFDVLSGKIRTSPMKGTRPRGKTPEKDAMLKEELRTSEKEILENTSVTTGITQELIPLCEEGTVRVTAPCRVLTFKQVHQMVSDVEGTLNAGSTLLNLLQSTFPATSMVGIPKEKMFRVLADLEGVPRGLYSGTYGWISADRQYANLSMAIRCAEIEGNRAVVGAGGGITRLSDPESELREVKLKAHAVLNALGAEYP